MSERHAITGCGSASNSTVRRRLGGVGFEYLRSRIQDPWMGRRKRALGLT